jgi:hypothetical protein
MLVLIRKGRATWADIDAAISGGEPRPELRSVLIHRIRRKFEAAGGNDPIETLRGWGLRLRVPPDERQSTSLWIGEPETSWY